MIKMPFQKYRPYPPVILSDRKWPSRSISAAPIWCSVDLRDGNQALAAPMSVEKKKDMFQLLVDIGFKEIEVGFPSASQTEYDFVRMLIEDNIIPDDVTIQVLTQARQYLISKTFEALRGAQQAIVHLYNSTSELQRRVVFGMDRSQVIDMAVQATRCVKAEAARMPDTNIIFQYSPESFTGTEHDFAIEICEAVMDTWIPSPEKKIVLNIPATVEMSMPNVYADRVELFCRSIKDRDKVIVSVHTHNDRGTAVAAAELALLAGADRVEGTLFGNGERTGNADIITIALNMFSQGIDPQLDFSDIGRLTSEYERTTKMPVHIRHPYAGELVYTAFSGSHQDAINKGMKAHAGKNNMWEVPYLPIDPADVGRTYESIIRINSQSGKSGIAYMMEREYGLNLPREMQPEFARAIQSISDASGSEVAAPALWEAFEKEYLHQYSPYSLVRCRMGLSGQLDASRATISASIKAEDRVLKIKGKGNGPIDAFSNALRTCFNMDFTLLSYHEHALSKGSDSKAVAYILIEKDRRRVWGCGIDTNIDRASFKAMLSALNRLNRKI
ncbi:MAG TPA: 2-isopropylmalate synthase [Dissulfurispiraceae bacterium]|nr:2-isopropylmalate synthase [Dissulfurispiraceae bacterium]